MVSIRLALPIVLTTIALSFVPAPALGDSFTPSTKNKKIINYGQDPPNTAYVRAHIQEMEERPYDGIVIGISKEREPKLAGDCIGYHVFSRERFDVKDYQHAIEDLRATKFKKFTDN